MRSATATPAALGGALGDAPGDALGDASGDPWLARAFAPGRLGALYQPVRVLGRGGMGVVVLARERALHRTVAVKLLRPELAESPRAVERFRREARIQAPLEHPGIVPLYAAGGLDAEAADAAAADGEARGVVPFLAMRYVAGGSLAAWLDARPGPAAPAAARRLLGEVADALAYAHGEGVVHRDLKPENVLLEPAPGGGTAAPGRALLTDFGVAARPSHDDPRTADRGAGTLRYMAPEQVAGEHAADGRTDVYALGVLGVALLTGRRPFPDLATAAVPAAHLAGPVPDVGALAPEAPRDLCRALARCLAKDPADRWPTAAAFRRALEPDAAPGPWAALRTWWGANNRAGESPPARPGFTVRA